MATIKEVAQRAGVSVTTVSRVLNGHPNVSNRARKKVLAVVEGEVHAGDTLKLVRSNGFGKSWGGRLHGFAPR